VEEFVHKIDKGERWKRNGHLTGEWRGRKEAKKHFGEKKSRGINGEDLRWSKERKSYQLIWGGQGEAMTKASLQQQMGDARRLFY